MEKNPQIIKYDAVCSTNVLASKEKNQNDANIVVIAKQLQLTIRNDWMNFLCGWLVCKSPKNRSKIFIPTNISIFNVICSSIIFQASLSSNQLFPHQTFDSFYRKWRRWIIHHHDSWIIFETTYFFDFECTFDRFQFNMNIWRIWI